MRSSWPSCDAYAAGVFVAASAGNAGPEPETTDHRGPWTTTVAASTQNRAFETTVTVSGGGGVTLTLTGTSITQGISPAPRWSSAGDCTCYRPFRARHVHRQDRRVPARRSRARRAKGLQRPPGRRGGDDPLQPVGRCDRPGDRQPLPAGRPDPVFPGPGAAQLSWRPTRRDGVLAGRRPRSRRRVT